MTRLDSDRPGVDRGDPYSPECLAEASVWITRLNADDRDRALEDGLREWLQAKPENARAFEMAIDLWEETENLRRISQIRRTPNRLWRRLKFPTIAVATAAAVGLIAFSVMLFSARGMVSTSVGEQRSLTLEDGSRVFLNTNTRIRVSYDARTRVVELEGGEALFDVAKKIDRPFVVRACSRSILALGTSFVVRCSEGDAAVTLLDGKVAVQASNSSKEAAQSPARGSVTLTPGQRWQVSANAPAEIDRPSLAAATAWRRGQVILDDTPLSQAVAEMNRYSALKLSVSDATVAELRISGLFQAGDSVSFANAIATTYGLKTLQRDGSLELAPATR